MASRFKEEDSQNLDHELTSHKSTLSDTQLSITANKENKKKKLIDSSHGLRFELELFTLFCLEGLGAGYNFELSKKNLDFGDNFDDLIFRYEVSDTTPAGKHWRYRFLQVKHKENEKEKITADHLLDYNRKGDFSLPKYFHSYYKIKARGEDIHHCIICTNIGFNLDSLKEKGVELVSIPAKPEGIVEFSELWKTALYKLKISDEDWHTKLSGKWSPLQLLFEELKDCATKSITTDIRAGMLNSYHVALVDEYVIDYSTKTFHQDFVSGVVNLSEGAKELRQTISELCENDEWKGWKFKLSDNFGKGQSAQVKNPLPRKIRDEDINDFFDKFIFVVDMPNEKKFEKIIETREVNKYYHPDHWKNQTILTLHEMFTKLSNNGQNYWLKLENVKKIVLAVVTKISLKFQEQLQKEIKFKDSVIECMVNQLKQKLLDNSGRKKVQRIFTPSPQHTAVKVISAVQILIRELKQEENYFVVPSTILKSRLWENILKLQKGFYYFLIAVSYPIGNFYYSMSNYEQNENNFVVVVGSGYLSDSIREDIKFTDLSEDFQKTILSTTVSFQGENLTVKELVGKKSEEIINFSSLKELLEKKELKIPSYDTLQFEESLYIKRRLKTPFDCHLKEEVARRLNITVTKLGEECFISPEGHIEWFVKDKRKLDIWEKIMDVVNTSPSSGEVHEENHLMNFYEKRKEKSMAIICGVAGTGKSTLLSHFYRQIKKAKPDHLIIKMNLADPCVAQHLYINEIDASDFFVGYFQRTGYTDSFAISLFKHRLETGDRIVFMFDGFNEIDVWCQMSAIELMKSISKKKSIQLYVTTRPHSFNYLLNEFFQFSYTLESFDIDDQINYLVKYWETRLQHLDIQDKSIFLNFAGSIADRVSQTIRDKERSLIGVPLQCRILAECFQPELQAIIKHNNTNIDGMKQTDYNNQLFTNFNFDLNSLYKLLMKTKRQVFCEEKANAVNQNQIMDYAINSLIRKIESHLTKLAIETLVTEKKNVDNLWPPQLSYHQLESEKSQDERTMAEISVQFGLIIFREGFAKNSMQSLFFCRPQTQFLHRTFAEYLFAKYLCDAIAVTHCEDNQLLDNEAVHDFIVNQILVQDNYDGVRVFMDSMLKETVHSEQWRRNLPHRLQNFVCSLAHSIKNPREYDEPIPLFPLRLHRNPLSFALQETNMYLFFTLFQCLERKFDKTEMNAIARNAFDRSCFSFNFFLYSCRSSELFQRILGYYDDGNVFEKEWIVIDTLFRDITQNNQTTLCRPTLESYRFLWEKEQTKEIVKTIFENDADAVDVQGIVKEILYRDITNQTSSRFTRECYLFLWGNEETKEIVKVVLDFLEKNQTLWYSIWGSRPANNFSVALLHFFTFNEYYDSLFKRFFYLLSSVYSNDSEFVDLLKYTLTMRDANDTNSAYPLNSGIEKTLSNLRDLKRYEVMQGLSHLALVSDKEVFDKFYQPCRPNKDQDFSDLKWLLDEKDLNQMTCLDRAAFYGDAQTVDTILETIRNECSFNQHTVIGLFPNYPSQYYAMQNLIYAIRRIDKRFLSFYVAAACGHKDICHKILSCFKEILGADRIKDLTENGFVYYAMKDAILLKNLQMFQMILEVVKKAWGQESLLILLQAENPEYRSRNIYGF